MQQATATIVNDIGLLTADQMPLFRAFLESKAVPVRDSGSGQFFHVRPPGSIRWLPIERGRAGAPVTPTVLRRFVDAFLETSQAAQPDGPVRLVAVQSFTPLERPACSRQGTKETSASSAADQRYLSDLRDDLALHAPVPWDPEVSAEQNAIRRWKYADVMLATRTTKDGD